MLHLTCKGFFSFDHMLSSMLDISHYRTVLLIGLQRSHGSLTRSSILWTGCHSWNPLNAASVWRWFGHSSHVVNGCESVWVVESKAIHNVFDRLNLWSLPVEWPWPEDSSLAQLGGAAWTNDVAAGQRSDTSAVRGVNFLLGLLWLPDTSYKRKRFFWKTLSFLWYYLSFQSLTFHLYIYILVKNDSG